MSSVQLPPPGLQELVALVNHELLGAADRRNDPFPSPVQLPPSQTVERVYWEVGVSTFAAAIDAVRNSTGPTGGRDPRRSEGVRGTGREAAEQAVDVALYGRAGVGNLVINQVATGGQGAVSGTGSPAIGSEPESRSSGGCGALSPSPRSSGLSQR